MYHNDRIDKIEENLNRVCYSLDTILPLLNLIDTSKFKKSSNFRAIINSNNNSMNEE